MATTTRFNVSVPVEISVHCTIYCGDEDAHGREHPASEYRYRPNIAVMGYYVVEMFGERNSSYPTEKAAIAAAKRYVKAWAKREREEA